MCYHCNATFVPERARNMQPSEKSMRDSGTRTECDLNLMLTMICMSQNLSRLVPSWDKTHAYRLPSDIFEPMAIDIELNLRSLRQRIAGAAERAGRDPKDIKLVAVSKTHPADVVRKAITAGISVCGESKVQEGEDKIAEIGSDAAEWHLIGHLQSNKARKAVQLFDVIQSLDSIRLAKRLERACIDEGRSELPVFVEVDLAGEETKTGIAEDDLDDLVRILRCCVCLRFEGLMVLPPYFEDPEATRPYFIRLRAIRDRLASEGAFANGRGELSMGMSHDFEIAIDEGATVVRVGTAIFGERQYGHR